MWFKGEIYNADALVSELSLSQGCGISAEELIRTAYCRWGTEAFGKLRGAFAFLLDAEDESGKRFYLVRDAFGQVPLYYCVEDGRTSSDSVRALLASGVPGRLSLAGLHSYLAYGSVQDPMTLVEGVVSLPPATYLELDASGRPVGEPRTYWRPSFETRPWTQADAQAAVTEALCQSVREALPKKGVPAAFLSGGVDSSAVVATLRKVCDGPVRTYCVIHEDPATDERRWARMVAERNGTEHTEMMLTGTDIKALLPHALGDYDQPSLDGLNVWFASKLVRDAGVGEILAGNGGDELFMGYGQFAKHRMAYQWAKRLRAFPSWMGRMVSAVAPNEKLRKFGQLFGLRSDPYYLPRRILADGAIRSLLNPALGELPGFPQLGGDAPTNDLLNRISWMELRTSVLSMYLRDGYQVTTPHGLCERSPILDTRLTELLFTMPGVLKTDPKTTKPLLVNAVPGAIPDECVYRRKQGFSLPFDLYFRDVLRDELTAFFEGGQSELFRPEALRKLWHAYLSGKVSWSRIWALYMVEDWCRRNHVTLA